jgi:hypothetical protein
MPQCGIPDHPVAPAAATVLFAKPRSRNFCLSRQATGHFSSRIGGTRRLHTLDAVVRTCDETGTLD